MLPAPGQGALAVQCRVGDPVFDLVALIDDADARAATTAERAFLRDLGAGCAAPVGAHARPDGPSRVLLDVLVASPDGRDVVQVAGEGEPEDVGARLAAHALESGAARILAAIRG
jgi:hydroxymethylbilane synthase